jgi:hypothetical protein
VLYYPVRLEGWILPMNTTQDQMPPGALLSNTRPLRLWAKQEALAAASGSESAPGVSAAGTMCSVLYVV